MSTCRRARHWRSPSAHRIAKSRSMTTSAKYRRTGLASASSTSSTLWSMLLTTTRRGITSIRCASIWTFLLSKLEQTGIRHPVSQSRKVWLSATNVRIESKNKASQSAPFARDLRSRSTASYGRKLSSKVYTAQKIKLLRTSLRTSSKSWMKLESQVTRLTLHRCYSTDFSIKSLSICSNHSGTDSLKARQRFQKKRKKKLKHS